MRKLLLLLCLLGAAEPARAEYRAGLLLAAYPTEEWAKAYLDGLASGIEWYAAAVDARRHHREYCPPRPCLKNSHPTHNRRAVQPSH